MIYSTGMDLRSDNWDAGRWRDKNSRNSEDVTVHGGAGDDSILIYSPHHNGFYFGDAGDDTFRVYRSSWTARDFHGDGNLILFPDGSIKGFNQFFAGQK